MPSEAPALNLNSIVLSDVNHFDIWDRRECAVADASLWKTACQNYKQTPEFRSGIPRHIHQIWIGARQPPCIWLDTWRLDFMHAFEKPQTTADAPWKYKLWDNDAVRNMHMLNRKLFDAEGAPQCQADILRLEILYKYGGVYVDADVVSTVRDLRPVLEGASDTGFSITYEPDTKDKPYSILGNSLIACTPNHPLVLMLMSYIKQVYPHKRAHYGVEWVTGPLTYTKVLVHTQMPITIPPSKDFYPSFHYIPNPSAIDVSKVDSYCFQFGYTCSGLSQWVAENNRCRRAHHCSYHANTRYPLGKLKQFPESLALAEQSAAIPAVIHQFYFGPERAAPWRWMNTWRINFCPNKHFRYELWTWDRLEEEIGSFYCANLYERRHMDSFSIKMLALEVLANCGGYYVPLTTVFTECANSSNVVERLFGSGNCGAHQCGSIIGYAKGASIAKIKQSYDSGRAEFTNDASTLAPVALVTDMGYGDDIAAFAEFKETSRFLGANEIYYVPQLTSDLVEAANLHSVLLWAYDCQVPIFRCTEEDAVRAVKKSGKRSIIITDSQFGLYRTLVDEIPGVMYRLEQEEENWDFIVLNVEWKVDEDGLAVYRACNACRAPTAHYLGFIVNNGTAEMVESTNVDRLLEQHSSGRVFVASMKSQHTERLASLYRALPTVSHAFKTLHEGFEPNFCRDYEEVMDNLFKGMRGHQVGFELQLDDQKRIMFRCWGDNGSINCECRIAPGIGGLFVEMLRVYEGQRVVCDRQGVHIQ